MKPGLSLRISQHLALTPQLQQSIRLLQLSTLELSQEVNQMLDDNPFLELSDEVPAREEFGLDSSDAPVPQSEREAELAPASAIQEYVSVPDTPSSDDSATPLSAEDGQSWEGDGSQEMAADDGEWGGDAKAHGNNLGTEDDVDAGELARTQETLQDHLHAQALATRLSDADRLALRFLIESLNDDGYLEEPLEELAAALSPADEEEMEQLQHHFRVALSTLKGFDPVGVGASDLGECLRLQLRAMQRAGGHDAAHQDLLAVAVRICSHPMDLLARRDVRRLSQVCSASDTSIKEAIALIARLEPKPGRRFVNVERNIVIPDVLVVQVGKGANVKFRAQINPQVMPKLRVHDIYANALRQHRGNGSDASNYAALQQRLQEARWFIKNIQQRFDTILRVSSAIVERQKNFFLHGVLAMRPLVLREIADELGLHESTISRVTTAKYMATPLGTFELKYFFGSSLGTETGGNASSTAVRALIKQFIDAESAKKPLSDNQLSEMLKEQGITCARRTVAKYREGLRIAPANLRRAL
jgi:RNA polymerase sigma-54 factor